MNDSTFSLARIWAQGDGVSHAVAIMLVLMSLASWSVIVVKAWNLLQLRRMSAGAKQFWHATSFDAGLAALAPAGTDNPFRELASRGTEAVSHHTSHRDDSRLGGQHRALHRLVRHRVGHLPRADRHRRSRPGHPRQGGRPGGRIAGDDRRRPRRGDSGGAGLQRAGAWQQGNPGQAQALLPNWKTAP